MFFQKYCLLSFLFIFSCFCIKGQNVSSQPHLQHIKTLTPIWKNLENKNDTLPVYSTNNKKLVLFHGFTLDTLRPDFCLFFSGILGKCEVYLNQALIWKGEDKYGKLLVSLPYSSLKKINVIQLCLYPKQGQQESITGLFQNVYLTQASPERASLTPPRYSSYNDTIALLYPYSYLYGLKGNKTLIYKQLLEIKQLHIQKVSFMLPPPDYVYSICDSLDIFIIDNTENSLHKFYFNTRPPMLKKSVLEYFTWYNESYTRTKYYQSAYTAAPYLPPDMLYNIKINLWLLSCILIGYLVFLKASFKDIISDFYDWFRRYRIIMEVVKNKKVIPSLWINLLTLLYWMIISAVFVFIIANYTFTEKSIIQPYIHTLLHNNLIWLFLLWLIFILFFAIIHLFFAITVSIVSQFYGRSKIFIRISEISLMNHFPILYFMMGVLFVLPLSPYILEYISWFVFYLTIVVWVMIRLYRMYRFAVKGLKLHDIVIILYLCGAEILPYFLLGFYIFNF